MSKKYLKTLEFWFIDTWNNIDQLQWSEFCIRMSDVGVWVGRIWPQILLEWQVYLYLYMYTHIKHIYSHIWIHIHILMHSHIRTHIKMFTYNTCLHRRYRPIHILAENCQGNFSTPRVVSEICKWMDRCKQSQTTKIYVENPKGKKHGRKRVHYNVREL